mgnify:CR=1 FL=1
MEFAASELVAAFYRQGLNSTVEDTGGGTATLTIDGGIVQVGPGAFGPNGATFDTTELSYGFYTIDDNGDVEEDSDAVWFTNNDTPESIAADVAKAYRDYKEAS